MKINLNLWKRCNTLFKLIKSKEKKPYFQFKGKENKKCLINSQICVF